MSRLNGRFYAYIRVSTSKQAEKGVSLQQQRDAIVAYSHREGIEISEWFEEVLTAAKKGRPLFVKMLKGLRSGEASGVVMHKIDRSARNLRDWADIAALIDAGIQFKFANENLDVQTRGGRLSADIQAIVAADYIRNLREEVRKGMTGRLKQGILPFSAPLGYLNMGKGKHKEIDPARGPLVRKAFELYDTGQYGHHSLRAKLERLGFRNRKGKPLSVNAVANILSNPFYAGIIRIRKTGETFPGGHAPLISLALFKRVRARSKGRLPTRLRAHAFVLRGVFRCSLCNRALIGERQKGHVYYRCHTKGCTTTGFREEALEKAVLECFPPSLGLTSKWRAKVSRALDAVMATAGSAEGDRRAHYQLQLSALKARQARLVDALVDGVLEKDIFNERKTHLLEEERLLEEDLKADAPDADQVKQFILGALELAAMAQQTYRIANPELRRELVLNLTSNRTVAGKEVSVKPYFPLPILENGRGSPSCAHYRGTSRTLQETARRLIEWAKIELKEKREADDERDSLAAAA